MAAILPSLPKSIFNPTLHRSILKLWFDEIIPSMTTPNDAAKNRWFGVGSTAEQKKAMDKACDDLTGPALDVLSPEKFPLPPWQSFDEDRRLTLTLSKPFRQVVHDDGAADPRADELSRTDVARALVLLLDQMPRNIFRDVARQRLVYGHYDRLARALVRSMLLEPGAAGELDVAGLDVARYAANPAVRGFFYLPLMHSENLADHDTLIERIMHMKNQCELAGDEEAQKYVNMNLSFEKQHRDLLERFGRYPHRNAAMGREMTADEKKYLEEGGDTFGVSSS